MVKIAPFDTLWGKHGTNIYWRTQQEPSHIVALPGFEGKAAPSGLFSYDASSGLLLIIIFIYSFMLFRSQLAKRGRFNSLFGKQRERSSIFEPELTAPEVRFKLLFRLLGIIGLTVYAYTNLIQLYPLTGSLASFIFLAIIGIALLLILSIKFAVFRILAYVFFQRKQDNKLIDSYFAVIYGLGVVLLPVVALQTLARATLSIWLTWFCVIACLIAVLLVLYKILQIFWHGYSSIFYIILYLCTLEILPVLVGIRLLQMIDISI